MRRNMRTAVLISALSLLIAANLFMMYATPFGLARMEGFQDEKTADESMKKPAASPSPSPSPSPAPSPLNMGVDGGAGAKKNALKKENFASYSLADGAGAREQYKPMGAFDGVTLSTGNASKWRYTSPNEPLRGPEFTPGPDELFMFKNNQCKPECCGSSFSCGGGCVCTTPQQRDYINQRGGNRTAPEDGV